MPVFPDLADDYYVVERVQPTVLQQNGGRVYVDHAAKVQRAREIAGLSSAAVPVTDSPPDAPAFVRRAEQYGNDD